MSASGFAGKPRRGESGGDDGDDCRAEEPNRPAEPVDAGCTTNNNTTAKLRVLRSPAEFELDDSFHESEADATIVRRWRGARRVARGRRDVRIARPPPAPIVVEPARDRQARRGARDRDRAAARAARARPPRRAHRAAICSRSVPPRAASAAPPPRTAALATAADARCRRPLPPLKLVRHRRGSRRRRPGADRDHLRRQASCSW